MSARPRRGEAALTCSSRRAPGRGVYALAAARARAHACARAARRPGALPAAAGGRAGGARTGTRPPQRPHRPSAARRRTCPAGLRALGAPQLIRQTAARGACGGALHARGVAPRGCTPAIGHARPGRCMVTPRLLPPQALITAPVVLHALVAQAAVSAGAASPQPGPDDLTGGAAACATGDAAGAAPAAAASAPGSGCGAPAAAAGAAAESGGARPGAPLEPEREGEGGRVGGAEPAPRPPPQEVMEGDAIGCRAAGLATGACPTGPHNEHGLALPARRAGCDRV